ncbi:DUF748 domain-containing protein [Candidatus Reidiella endopervernicosa]|uniref:DUF748 domain-containing protein n=1 Tax=Candidatus Reidiella endopervernicosa TaxID=2738883 RepID=A0A6N0HW52_9GAMM|nr:DUF748 domain-containing protein [Candidatus Reidiella endopervernicosa]QKQ26406.1 DUF748 domain-containing protein [Candidatus Reidiella endopervernicosa]
MTTEQLATTIGTETKSGIDQLTIDSTTSLSHSEVGAMKLDFDGTIDARGARYRRADIAYRNQQLTYKGNAQITLPVEHSPSVVINGDISHKQLALALAENHLNVSQQQGAWSGNIYVKENKPSATGSLSSGTTQIDDSNKQLTLARYHHLNAKEIELRAIDDLTIGSLRSEQLTLLKPHTTNSDEKSEQLFNSGSLTLDNLHYQADQITAINSITLDNMALLLRRTAKGEIALINQLQSGKSDKSDPGSKQQIPIKIQQIKVTGKSHLDFVDEAITPNYKNRITLKQLAVNQIDSSTPSTGSPFELKANIGSYTHLAFGGELYPFAEHPTLKLKGDIDTLDLPPLSPYTIQSLGYELTSGHASAEIELEIDAGKLKGENRVKLNNLEVDAADPEKMEHLSNQLSMPLDSALSLLRDDENNIKLKLPLGGDLAHPEFSLANTINQALGKAMKTTAMTYLKYYFQPYGTLIAIAELAEAAASAVRLDPITYPATISSLNPEQIKYLEKVGKLMQEHKQIRVRLCGKANESEIKALLAAKQKAAAKESGEPSAAKTAEEKQPVVAPQMTPELEQQLTEVARARAETIQKHLMEHYQIEAERLFVCNPKIETDSDEKPRVELLI